MIVAHSLEKIPSPSRPIGLTIGTFDGVHLGHQALFRHLRNRIGSAGTLAALTFSNHPSELWNHQAPTPFLCTVEHRLKLFEKIGVDLVILLTFDAAFSKKPFNSFLQELKTYLPFTFLILGEGASFGKGRQGTPETVKALAPRLGFAVEYLPKTLEGSQPVSSGRIRQSIQRGDLAATTALLGRPYSIFATFSKQDEAYEAKLPTLCLPPNGCYPVQVFDSHSTLSGEVQIVEKTIRLSLTDLQRPISEKSIEILFTSC
jgi:riboflavin kinase/FMN adenylyltransferase